MPTSKTPKDAPVTQAAASDVDAPVDAPAAVADVEPVPDGPEPGVYAYTYFADCVYPHVPLTARAATDDRPATVFDWPFGPPADGRWTKTTKKPNQAADNDAVPLTSEE
jgi:hypothetical protein